MHNIYKKKSINFLKKPKLITVVFCKGVRQIKKLSVALKECTRELEEIRMSKDEMFGSSKDWEKKFKNIEMLLVAAQEERDLAERQRKQAIADRDDVQNELDSLTSGKNVLYEDKRRLDAKIAELEEELEDEQNNNEQMLEKFKKVK